MENDFFKLPFIFSEELLLKDLEACQVKHFVPHFNAYDYTGAWTSISLRSPDGKSETIFAHANGEEGYKDTDLLKHCHYFKKVIDSFACEKTSIRLLNLSPGSVIKEHTDYNLGYEDDLFRIHVPIATNPQVEFRLNGQELNMQVGECWYGNFNLPHSVCNNGDADRIHLVMDCLRNDWSDVLFKEVGYNFDLENSAPTYSREEKLKMIASLKHIDSEASRGLIAQLESELLNEK